MRNYLVLILLSLAAGFGGSALYGRYFAPKPAMSIGNQPIKLANYPNDIVEHPDFISASAKATPSVVHIKVSAGSSGDSDMKRFFNLPDQEQGGSGSGVIITADGYIVTNNHVVEGAVDIEVVLDDKRSFTATLIGTDPNTDLAVIKIEASDLPSLSFGNSDNVLVGEWVLAVGNPFNLTSTVTAGIISAKGRNINILGGGSSVESFLQTDAAVNPGNSGGALVNIKGELIGINTAIASYTGSYSGYSFAIPANLAQKVVKDIMEFGIVQRGFLGVQIRDVDATLVKDEELKVSRGVYVPAFSANSAAEEAGIEIGDVIVKIDGSTVNSSPELQEMVSRKRPGDKVVLTVNREGNEKDYTVVLRNQNGKTTLANKETIQEEMGSALSADFEAASREELSKLRLTNGVKVAGIQDKSKLFKVGIKKGFIITKIDGRAVSQPKQLVDILSKKEKGDSIKLEGYYPDGQRAFYGFEL
jgi:serine protease Do